MGTGTIDRASESPRLKKPSENSVSRNSQGTATGPRRSCGSKPLQPGLGRYPSQLHDDGGRVNPP